ncbi:hypothetical protein OG863_14040 [Streptomyces decoyicus]|uniref:YD repeat-containing protein n=1 Tax=Streptomyces decoyicus TaxID=249567 RepID=A0ABZ1FF14_9ACTN|nr:hypothetical protein [Streptomyces decoyicus]WSB68986.1 hypothetical protein OG863_14040 [Streptomyces decoyicus]
MRSENTLFVGGPLDGRVLPVLVGMTGQPPKTYEVPVPHDDDRPPTVHLYRRVPGRVGRLGLPSGWKYEYDPEGKTPGTGLKWPWRKPR